MHIHTCTHARTQTDRDTQWLPAVLVPESRVLHSEDAQDGEGILLQSGVEGAGHLQIVGLGTVQLHHLKVLVPVHAAPVGGQSEGQGRWRLTQQRC